MKNQDWRERFDEKFPGAIYVELTMRGVDSKFDGTKEIMAWFESELQAERERVKKQVLDGLPIAYDLPDVRSINYDEMAEWNACLSDVKQLIESL